MWVLGVWLVVDGVGSGYRVAQLLPALPGGTAWFAVLLGVRLLVSALSLTSGWLVVRRRPQGAALAPAALVLSAVLTSIDRGWIVAAVNWVWATGWSVKLIRK